MCTCGGGATSRHVTRPSATCRCRHELCPGFINLSAPRILASLSSVVLTFGSRPPPPAYSVRTLTCARLPWPTTCQHMGQARHTHRDVEAEKFIAKRVGEAAQGELGWRVGGVADEGHHRCRRRHDHDLSLPFVLRVGQQQIKMSPSRCRDQTATDGGDKSKARWASTQQGLQPAAVQSCPARLP